MKSHQEFGTFISPDPLLNNTARFISPQRWTPYRYTRNNPINYVDPDGRESRFAIRQDARVEALASGEITRQEYHDQNMAEGVGAVVALTLISPIDEVAIGAALLGKAAVNLAKGAVNLAKAAKAAKGLVDPNTIKFTQNSVKKTFGKGKDGPSLQGLIDDLKSGKVTANDIPAIRTFKKDGQTFSLHNRRVIKMQQISGVGFCAESLLGTENPEQFLQDMGTLKLLRLIQ